MCLLANSIIKKLIEEKKLISGYKNLDEQLQPNGFDLTVAKVEKYLTRGVISTDGKILPKMQEMPLDQFDCWTLEEGKYLMWFNEEVKLPNDLAAFSIQRSTIQRSGNLAIVGSWDRGYNGKGCSLLEVGKEGLCLQKNSRVVQLHFMTVLGSDSKGYNGSYQNENLQTTSKV